jgi:hypothetical protein
MLPTSGITTEIVRLKLDENFKDIGLLCTSNKINMWSKYKPVSYSSVSGIYPNSTGTTILSSIDYGIQYIEHITSNYKTLVGGYTINRVEVIFHHLDLVILEDTNMMPIVL